MLLIALSLSPGTGRAAMRAALQAAANEGVEGVTDQRQLATADALHRGSEILALAELRGIRVLVLGEEEYPERLAHIPDAPPILFVRGEIERVLRAPSETLAVAIVGARRATGYGVRAARRIAEEVTEAGGVVVSGLARGIDTAAHEGAIDAAKRVGGSAGIAVLGSGLLRVYPQQNRELADTLCDLGGCVLSEYPPLDPPSQYNFPERNRVVSGLSNAVVVVEAGERSGALITARLAAEQGRDVLAVPGPIDSQASVGSNELLFQGAALCRGLEDILECNSRLRGLVRQKLSPSNGIERIFIPDRSSILSGLSADDRGYAMKLLGLIEQHGSADFEALLAHLSSDAPRLRATLVELELAGLVLSLPGNRFATSDSIDR